MANDKDQQEISHEESAKDTTNSQPDLQDGAFEKAVREAGANSIAEESLPEQFDSHVLSVGDPGPDRSSSFGLVRETPGLHVATSVLDAPVAEVQSVDHAVAVEPVIEVVRCVDGIRAVAHVGAVETLREFAFDRQVEGFGLADRRRVQPVEIRVVDGVGPGRSIVERGHAGLHGSLPRERISLEGSGPGRPAGRRRDPGAADDGPGFSEMTGIQR